VRTGSFGGDRLSFDYEIKSVQMCVASRRFFCIVILVMAGWMMTSEAWAHRGGGPNDPCERRLGASLIHLTLYQPQFDPGAEYCDEVPREGKTVVVVDVSAGDLRQVPMSLEVVATGDSETSRTVLLVPPKVYRWGVADVEVTLNAGSDSVARVVLEQGADRKPHSLSFPIRVAAWYRAIIVPALIVATVLALTAISVIRYYVISPAG
jgi:hypothetical protein